MRSHRVNAGNDLGGQLGHDDHDDAGQQSSFQQKGLRVKLASWGLNLDESGNWEKESVVVSSVDCCQLGSEEDQAHNKDLYGIVKNRRMMSAMKMAVKTTWRPKRNLSMLSPLAAI